MKIERINNWFALRGKRMMRNRWVVLGGFILILAIGVSDLGTSR